MSFLLCGYKAIRNTPSTWRLKWITLAVLSVCVSQWINAQVTYDVTDLGALGPGSIALGINDRGDVVGITGAAPHAFLWQKGRMVDLGTLEANLGSAAWSINNFGEIAGAAERTQTQDVRVLCQEADLSGSHLCRAVFWNQDHGSFPRELGTFGGLDSVAYGINDLHEIAGAADTRDTLHAFLWRGGSLIDLGTPRGIDSAALAINNREQLAINAHLSRIVNPKLGEPDYHAFLWDRGLFTDLGTLGGSASFAFGMNNQADVVGYSSLNGDEVFDAFLWKSGVMLDLGRLPGDFFAQASGLNQRSEVVGTSVGVLPRAFVWRDGQIFDLNTLISHDSNWVLVLAQAINEHGQIVGGGVHNGEAHAFLLTPHAKH
jgi:probable HAF family extracellular repeat protein